MLHKAQNRHELGSMSPVNLVPVENGLCSMMGYEVIALVTHTHDANLPTMKKHDETESAGLAHGCTCTDMSSKREQQ